MDNTKLHTADAVGDHTIGAVRILTDQGIQIAGCYVPGTERNNEADAAELVHRWNAHQELRDNLQGLLTAARKAAAHAEHSPDYADEDAHYVGEWIDSASQFLETLKSTK
jgi:hypothetical protein